MIDINRNPTQRELGVFGVLLALITGILGILLYWRWELPRLSIAVVVAGAILAFTFAVFPRSRRSIYLGWMAAVYPIGVVVSYALLATIYYAILTPIGLLRRWLLGDALTRQWDTAANSYWIERTEEMDHERYFHQY